MTTKTIDRETIIPESEQAWLELRKADITSTDVSALFGISPYKTLFELWHEKKQGNSGSFEASERMRWGTRLQEAIAKGIAEEQGWMVRRMDEYIRLPELRMGASFDFEASEIKDSADPVRISGWGPKDDFAQTGLLEIKNVDSLVYNNEWEEEEAPPHIEIQIQHQLAVSGNPFAYLGALVGGNKLVLLRREPVPSVIDGIKKKIAAFWASIDANEEPEPDFSKDADFIAKLYSYSEPGKVIEADTEIVLLAGAYKQFSEAEKLAVEQKDAIKAQLLTLIGDAEKVKDKAFTISAGLVGPKWIAAYERSGFRNFRISWKKEKEAK